MQAVSQPRLVVQEHLDLRQHAPLVAALQEPTVIPAMARALLDSDEQRAIPAIAKDAALMGVIRQQVRILPSTHSILLGDSRQLDALPDESVQLALTSPPYWTLKRYVGSAGQLGDIAEYEAFLAELDQVWRQLFRVLAPGGRLIVVVGDVCVSRRKYGRHLVFPLHASIQEHCRALGFDNLAPIIWYKIANAALEAAGNGASFLGKPYEPGGVIKNDIEYILMQRKGGAYRKPTLAMRVLSILPEDDHRRFFQQIWDLPGASTRHHPAPYPLELAERLIRMFSFVGDTVLDPFLGTGTTSLAASLWGRNSIGIEIEPQYHQFALKRLRQPRGVQLSLQPVAGL